jgi:hypothetical protein
VEEVNAAAEAEEEEVSEAVGEEAIVEATVVADVKGRGAIK